MDRCVFLSHDRGRRRYASRRPAKDRACVLGRIVARPCHAVGVFPFRIAHLRMMRDAVVEVIFVHVRIHPGAVLQKTLWSSEPGKGVRKKNSRISSGNSHLMISTSRRIESLVSEGKPRI